VRAEEARRSQFFAEHAEPAMRATRAFRALADAFDQQARSAAYCLLEECRDVDRNDKSPSLA
jgi:hypothetical protein